MSAPAGRGGRSTAGLRELPPARWVDLGLVVILELVAAVLFVPPFGSPVGARAAAATVRDMEAYSAGVWSHLWETIS